MILGELDRRRFEALAGYARVPNITLITRELLAFSTADERVLGLLLLDLIDDDYSFVVFGRDEMLRYRAVDVGVSHETLPEARGALLASMEAAALSSSFEQGDSTGEPVDFFASQIPTERQNRNFKLLVSAEKYSPARDIITAMMRYHQDLDGRWIQNFQAAGFDARIWELYLWATFIELGFVRRSLAQVPDFILDSLRGPLAIEAATANPPDGGGPALPPEPDQLSDYVRNFIPYKLSQALKGKLRREPPYWEEADAKGMPFCIAVQDFSAPGAMRYITQAATEYVFGVRHSLVEGKPRAERIRSHRYGKKIVRSGFFNEPGAENVSAVIVNPQGTLIKFNRLGYIAGFGGRNVRMTRTGVERREGKPGGPFPRAFHQTVDGNYQESWVEGMVVLHNPGARIPLDPNLIPGAAHEFLQLDGTIKTLLPEFHPFMSQTYVGTVEDLPKSAPGVEGEGEESLQ